MIRTASGQDTPALLGLCMDQYRSMTRTLRMVPFSSAAALKTLLGCLEKGVIFVAEEDSKVVGCLAIDRGPFWYSEAEGLHDVFYFVRPEHRTSNHGIQLLRSAREYAKIAKMPLVLTVASGEDLSRKDKLFKWLGFRTLGGLYSVGI